MFKFSEKSLSKLSTCDEDLYQVMLLAITYSPYDFGVTEGLRTAKRQSELFKEGRTTTLNSRHLSNKKGESDACDIIVYVDGKATWEIRYYRKVAAAVFKAAIDLGIQIEWGGLWEGFVDGPHFQIKRK